MRKASEIDKRTEGAGLVLHLDKHLSYWSLPPEQATLLNRYPLKGYVLQLSLTFDLPVEILVLVLSLVVRINRMSQLKWLPTQHCAWLKFIKLQMLNQMWQVAELRKLMSLTKDQPKAQKHFDIKRFCAKIFTVNAKNCVCLRSKMETKVCNTLHIYAHLCNTQ